MFLLAGVLILCGSGLVLAQPPAAIPIAEIELRQNSIKTRQRALEIFKQESRKSSKKRKENFPEETYKQIRQDFENIQLLQNKIVEHYTKQKVINFETIQKYSSKILESSERLHQHLFPDVDMAKVSTLKSDEESANLPSTIVNMDNSLAAFVSNPIFQKPEVLKIKDSERARRDLEVLIYYSKHLGYLSEQILKKK